jgi:hypothetical protein
LNGEKGRKAVQEILKEKKGREIKKRVLSFSLRKALTKTKPKKPI